MVGVLVLVHQDVLEAAAVVVEDLRERAEHLHRLPNEIVEVQGIGGAQPLHVTPVHLGHCHLERVGAIGTGKKRFIVHELVLESGNLVLDGLGSESFGVQFMLLGHLGN